MTDGTTQLIRRYYDEVWTRGNADACDELLADDYLDHDPTPGFGADKAGAKEVAAAITSTMRDVDMAILHIIVDGEFAAAHWTMQWWAAAVRSE